MARRLVAVAALVAALAGFGCGKADKDDDSHPLVDADAGPDAENPDGALPDGGSPDAQLPDIVLPTAEGWTFYGTANGGPRTVLGVSADQAGNVWVAGGEEGLFLLRPGATSFRRFTTDDGLHPYGYPTAEQGVIGRIYMKVIAVAGGPANTVFVGYEGIGIYGSGYDNCEDNWDGPSPNPDIYKSGDADKVILSGDSIRVVHYDISSGKDIVRDEPRGREKVCTVYRIVYDARTASLWFGGNHGYAWGDPSYAGNPTCYGQLACSGVMEHAHALLNGYGREDSTSVDALTNYYRGVGLESSGELWMGGFFRTQHCPSGNRGSGFWDCNEAPFIDWWPDPVPEYSRPSEREGYDDNVSSMAAGADGSIWVGSFEQGLAHRLPGGGVDFVTSGLVDPKSVHSVAVDPLDGSVWVGAGSGGLTRIQGGSFVPYDHRVFGAALASKPISDIQVDRGGSRRILVGFRAGAIGIYTGD